MKRTILGGILMAAIVSYSGMVCAKDGMGEIGRSKTIIQYFRALTKSTKWQRVDEVKLSFRTFHPQGLVKVGDYFYVSSVKIIVPPKKFEILPDGYDRSPGEGVGYLFKFDSKGDLVSKVTLGEGTVYHPGGIDYDGRYIWVPVAEYRPNSHYIDYQDCHYLSDKYMLCGRLSNYDIPDLVGVALGGLELVDLGLQDAVYQIPVMLYVKPTKPMTQNPFFFEIHGDDLRFFFIPEDDESTLNHSPFIQEVIHRRVPFGGASLIPDGMLSILLEVLRTIIRTSH